MCPGTVITSKLLGDEPWNVTAIARLDTFWQVWLKTSSKDTAAVRASQG